MNNLEQASMRTKISITLSPDLLAEIDRSRGPDISRSKFVERVLREYFKQKAREAIDQRDLELINANIEYLNREMEDSLKYQAPIDFPEEEEE